MSEIDNSSCYVSKKENSSCYDYCPVNSFYVHALTYIHKFREFTLILNIRPHFTLFPTHNFLPPPKVPTYQDPKYRE